VNFGIGIGSCPKWVQLGGFFPETPAPAASQPGVFLTKFNLLKTGLAQKQFQFQSRSFVRFVQNPIGPRRTTDVVHGILPGRLFKVLVKGAQQTGGVVNHLAAGIIEIGVGDLRGWQAQAD
jgi:hypothetical protein